MAVLDIPSNFKLTVGIISLDNLTLGLLEVEIITCKILTLGQFYFTWLGFGHFTSHIHAVDTMMGGYLNLGTMAKDNSL